MHLFRALLLTLPGWFREEFGSEMAGDFRDSLADAQRRGRGAWIFLWSATVRDVSALALRLHLEAARQDLSYAMRTLGRTRGITLAIVATLTVGMGPTLVVANLLQQVVLAPLPFVASDRLVSVWMAQPERDRHEFPLSLPDFIDFRDGQQMFEALAAHTGTSVAMVGDGEPRQVTGVLTTSELFQVLRIAPVLGRPLTPADSAPGAANVIVLGEDFWRSEFGARADAIGETIRLDGEPTEIVGVLPALDFPNGSRNFWIPITVDVSGENRGSHFLTATGRLASGVTVDHATDALNAIAHALGERYPSTNAGSRVEIVPLKDQLNGDAPRIITVLAVAIVAVLLIACTNVASLLAVRSSIRSAELAVRCALGASVRRLRRQLLFEHLVLAVCAALVAAAVGIPMHRLLVEQRLLPLPRTAPDTIAWPAFGMLFLIVIAVAVVFSRVAARRTLLAPRAAALLSGSRQTGTRSQLRLRQGLVVLEVAGALALVVVAGLMIRSAAKLASVDPGFRTDVITFGVVLPGSQYAEAALRVQFVGRVVEQLRAIPGVEAAASAAYAPMGQMRATRRFSPADRPPPPPGSETLALDMPVGAGYFEVMGLRVLEGRTISARDTADARPVIVISETFAREQFPGEPAVGKVIRFYASRPDGTPPPSREVIGVVSDVRQDGVRLRPIAQMYTPYAQTPWGFTSFFVRVTDDPAAVMGSLQRAVSRVDPMRPVRDVKTTAQIVSDSTSRQRVMTWMLAALAAIALLLATIGLYAVSATAASARSRELAIRAAIGAQPQVLVRLMLAHGVLTGLLGVGAGAVAGSFATRGLETLLFETPPRDPVTFAGTALLLFALTLVATYIPARRALRANPAEVLRAE